jgi:hypothetical protein
MRNIWKGMVLGAVTGALIGFVMDLMARAGEAAVDVGHRVHDRIPEVVEQSRRAGHAAVERVRDSDVVASAKEAVGR